MQRIVPVVLGLITVVAVAGSAVFWWPAGDRNRDDQRQSDRDRRASAVLTVAAPLDVPAGLPDTAPVSCPAATVSVQTADQLTEALAGASAGTVIALADGRYDGNFTASATGTAAAPIFVCGSRDAVLDAGGPKEGYVLHLGGAAYWRFVGFTVSNGQKGVMADGATFSVIQDLHVTGTGDEAIHLRQFSTDNAVIGNDIDTTGLRRDKFGEGVYVGTAQSNWCKISNCEPDRSDRNVVVGNHISGTGSESVDLKEGTTGGLVQDNSFDGTGMTGADSWVDVKGNGWLIQRNAGVHSPLDGYQTHNILDDWGLANTFAGNVADVNADGFGYALRPLGNNVLRCDNTATGAGSGFATASCGP